MATEAGGGPKAAGAYPWVENAPTKGGLALPSLRELVRFRDLAWVLARRDLQLRYKQTFLGAAWAVLQPLAGAFLFSGVFGKLAGLPSDGVPYLVFALSGLIAWAFLAGGTTQATTSLVDNEAFVTKVYFARLLVPVAAVLPGLVDLALSLVVLAIVMIVLGVTPGLAILLLPLWVLALVVLTAGVGSLFAASNISYRDVGHGIPFLTQLWLFASPVAYASSLASGKFSWVYYLNPMAGLLDAFRWSAVGTSPPPTEALLSLGVGLLVVLAGVVYFGRVERRFADVI